MASAPLLLLLALVGAPLFAVIAASALARVPQRGGRPVGGRHRDLPPGRDAGPARHPALHLRGLRAGRERGARAPGAAHRRVAGLAAGRPGHRLPGGLRALHRLYRRLRGHHRGPGRAALPRAAAGAVPRALQPGAHHHLGQPGAALRPGAAPDPVRRRGAADGPRAARVGSTTSSRRACFPAC